MRQMVKNVKGGKDITFTCSKCGNFVHSMFVCDGDENKSDWDKIPEKCVCGTKLTGRHPIIDIGIKDTCGERENVCRDIHVDVSKGPCDNVHEKYNINSGQMEDLENAISIDYFDMRLNGLKKRNFKIPDNLDYLRMECIKRNISHIESSTKQLFSTDDVHSKREVQERLNILRQQYSDLSEKLEDRKRGTNKKDPDKKT